MMCICRSVLRYSRGEAECDGKGTDPPGAASVVMTVDLLPKGAAREVLG